MVIGTLAGILVIITGLCLFYNMKYSLDDYQKIERDEEKSSKK